eukprot:PhF_6_TR36179/c0_g1_i1/m.52711
MFPAFQQHLRSRHLIRSAKWNAATSSSLVNHFSNPTQSSTTKSMVTSSCINEIPLPSSGAQIRLASAPRHSPSSSTETLCCTGVAGHKFFGPLKRMCFTQRF